MANDTTNGAAGAERVSKLVGADIELGNMVLGLNRPGGTGAEASRALLREIRGLPLERSVGAIAHSSSLGSGTGTAFNPQDWGRKYQPANGGCFYIDLDHLEICTPETLSAYDHAAAFHAMLRMARTALQTANQRLPSGQKIVAVVNNSDGLGHSYGSHLNVLLTRKAWDDIFSRRLHYLLYLASFQVSSVIFTGQGKVAAENGTLPVRYQLSQRADFFNCLTGAQTTYNRPIVNSRDEAHCGRWGSGADAARNMARLHSIFFDSTLCPASIVLRVGLMQIILSLIEAQRANSELILDDPVDALVRWSHDPSLQARARLVSGSEITALDMQQRFLEEAGRFVDQGGCDGIVPQAREIIALWAETLDQLRAGNLAALAPRLDWVLKLSILERACQDHPELDWGCPAMKHLDFLYGDLDQGLFWSGFQGGSVDRLGLTEQRVQRFVQEPPEETRAWTRAQLLRLAEPEMIDSVDWDSITFRLRDAEGWPKKRTVSLANPLGFSRRKTEVVFQSSQSVEEVLDLLGAPERDPVPTGSGFTVRTVDYYEGPDSPFSRLPDESPDSGSDNE